MTADDSRRLKITEIFHSLQGEADTVGFPTVFVRLTGCPLRCQYCDTAYAFHGGEWQTLDIVFRSPKFDDSGRKTSDARFVVVKLNGQVVQQVNAEINLPNLRDNILPTRPRADLILRKGPNHEIAEVALRRL